MTSSAQDIIAYGEEVESEIRSRIEANPTESVEKYLYINTYSDSGLVIAGAKSFAAWWTDLLGAENLGARATNSSVNMEQIYEWNPDKIFILTFSDKTPADIYNNTVGEDDWSGITAVKEEHSLIDLALEILLAAGTGLSRAADGVEALCILQNIGVADLCVDTTRLMSSSVNNIVVGAALVGEALTVAVDLQERLSAGVVLADGAGEGLAAESGVACHITAVHAGSHDARWDGEF